MANKPILFYGIEDMVAAGITEIGIITGETGPEVARRSATAHVSVPRSPTIGTNLSVWPLRADRP